MTSVNAPPQMNEACRVRYELAQELVKRCPPNLGQEIAIIGSVARGIADSGSDIELNFWVNQLPSELVRDTWLHGVGAKYIVHDKEPLEDGTIWSTFRYQGIWIEAGWQTVAALEANLLQVVSGEVLDHDRLRLAAMLRHALPVRGEGVIMRCKQAFAVYPDVLQSRLITNAIQQWLHLHQIDVRWQLQQRGETLALVDRLVQDVYQGLRILFALNREWEPDWKWLTIKSEPLTIKPDRLWDRVNEVLDMPLIDDNVKACYELILDILALVPTSIDVSGAMTLLKKSLIDHRRIVPAKLFIQKKDAKATL